MKQHENLSFILIGLLLFMYHLGGDFEVCVYIYIYIPLLLFFAVYLFLI